MIHFWNLVFYNLKNMDLQDQLKNLFPDHEMAPEEIVEKEAHELYVQKEPMI